MADTFLGAWLVSEYVYNPDGRFVGIIHQRRELAQLANGRIRVTQHCQPSAALDGHPMARFTGVPVFELSTDGRYRRYHGPAVIGSGITWGAGAITGSGIWPTFGHNFRSFAVQPTANLQLTGGQFFNASEMVAHIAGIAIPAETAADYPTLPLTYAPQTAVWMGTITTLLADGTLVEQQPSQRTYQSDLHWQEDGAEWQMTNQNGRLHTHTAHLQGFAKQVGPLREMELVNANGRMLQQMELLHPHHLIAIRRCWQDGILEKVDVLRYGDGSNPAA
jgi:hypothetical protein